MYVEVAIPKTVTDSSCAYIVFNTKADPAENTWNNTDILLIQFPVDAVPDTDDIDDAYGVEAAGFIGAALTGDSEENQDYVISPTAMEGDKVNEFMNEDGKDYRHYMIELIRDFNGNSDDAGRDVTLSKSDNNVVDLYLSESPCIVDSSTATGVTNIYTDVKRFTEWKIGSIPGSFGFLALVSKIFSAALILCLIVA